MIFPYLGAYHEPETPVEVVLEQVRLAREFGGGVLSDFDPLVVVMELVAQEVRGIRLSPRGPKGGQVWIEAMSELQEDRLLGVGHNRFLPCRTCDRAFRPEINRQLLKVFLSWSASRSAEDLVALHHCQACGGTITELESKIYKDDYHTPEPGFEGTDEKWSEKLLHVSGYWASDD
jgi:hypothetical protein